MLIYTLYKKNVPVLTRQVLDQTQVWRPKTVTNQNSKIVNADHIQVGAHDLAE